MRTNARLDHEIRRDIQRLKAHARPGLRHIHLIKCDFARVKHDPRYFDAILQPDGRIVTVLNNDMIEVGNAKRLVACG